MLTQINQMSLKSFSDSLVSQMDQMVSILRPEVYEKAVEIIRSARENGCRVHITGIGKPSYVAGYIASLLSSTGTPCYLLHGTEAVHGSSGQVVPGDVVIAISNSGETAELRATVTTLIKNGAKIIGVGGCDKSWLAHNSDTFLFAGVTQEGGPLNRAPRASILAELITLQGLTVVLQSIANITPTQYVSWHPGGALGQLRENEK